MAYSNLLQRLLASCVLTSLFLVGLVPRAGAAQEPAPAAGRQLASLSTSVGQTADQKRWATQLAEQQRRLLRQANQSSSSAWYAIHDRSDWEQFRKPILDALRKSLGQWPPAPDQVRVKVVGQMVGDGFIVERLAFESRPGWWVTANRYRPACPDAKAPGFLIAHAHHTPKEHAELQDMGMTWARHGCVVLVPDQLGHGERRQHPFVTEDDGQRAVAAWDQLVWQHREQSAKAAREPSTLPKATFRLSRQDYYFRYDSALQLYLAGESLIGWMVWDLMRAVDVLIATPGVDSQRLVLLGAVAGGGDPAAVTAALDERIAVAVPFNFGGPQPETRYPLPDDAETSFNYAGSGSWESTRNLPRSAVDGFLPWVIVGGIAPRRLVFAHEFHWDQPRDPVWRRLSSIYQFYEAPDRLSFTHGQGELRQTAQEATHCTHIGPPHRVRIHAALERWFDLHVTKADEYSHPISKGKLLVFDDATRRRLEPQSLSKTLGPLVDERLSAARAARAKLPREMATAQLRQELEQLLGGVAPSRPSEPLAAVAQPVVEKVSDQVNVERLVLRGDEGLEIPLLILTPSRGATTAVVVAVSQAGKAAFVSQRATEIAQMLEQRMAIVLPDLRGIGESREDEGRGRTSSATSRSSTDWMLGRTLLGGRVRDLRGVLGYLRTRAEFREQPLGIWGDSFAPANPPGDLPVVPHDAERHPSLAEPGGAMLALLTALFELDVRGVWAAGGVSGFRGVVDHPQVLVPHDVIVPGILATADIADLAAAFAPRPLCLSATVTAQNQSVTASVWEHEFAVTAKAYADAPQAWSHESTGVATWMKRVLLP